MTAKEIFREIAKMEAFIETKKQRVSVLSDLASNPGSPNYSGMPHNPSPDQSRLASIICKKIDLEQEVKSDEQKLQEKKLYVLTLIGEMENADFQAVLIKRYFEHLSWGEISAWMHFSESWAYKTNAKALAALDKIIAEEPKVYS